MPKTEKINIQINGMPYSVPAGVTILEAAQSVGVDIPTLCYLKDVNEIGACRLCLVEVKGARGLVTACMYPVNEGMEVFTNTPKVMQSRKYTLELILSNHDMRCLSCIRSTDCELQKLCRDYGVDNVDHFKGQKNEYELDVSAPHMVRDNNKCILCRRCVAACKNASAMLFVSAKVSHLALLPQGKVEAANRVQKMVEKMDELGFGNCTNTYACEAECPKLIKRSNIARLNREWICARVGKEK